MQNYNWPYHCFIKKNNNEKFNSEEKLIIKKDEKMQIFPQKNAKTSDISSNKDKEQKLQILKEKIKKEANIIFKNSAHNFVWNDGNINANIMFIGEAPGQEEDIQGIPFVGRSGQLLRFFLKEAKINDFYITNIVPWRPPNNRTPTPEEIDIMKPYILQHINIIQPKIIVTVGTTALKTFDINETITKVQNTLISYQNYYIFPIYHPSYALRVNSKKKELWYSLLNLFNYKSKLDNSQNL